MYDYKTKWHDESNNIWFVMNEEKDGWELFQIVPSSRKSGYEYWFRRPLYPKTPVKPAFTRQNVTC
jgi:antibiotic biosynthesis monooxygenase (ABM) superfamily enzyme